MNILSEHLFKKLEKRKEDILIYRDEKKYRVKDVLDEIKKLETSFKNLTDNLKVGLIINDPYNYVILDLLLIKKGYLNITIPEEFSDDQIKNFLDYTDIIITDKKYLKERINKIICNKKCYLLQEEVFNIDLPLPLNTDIPYACKITHTSGTTSSPKGIVHSFENIFNSTNNILERMGQNKKWSYFSINPLSLLIEQIFLIYIPILSNGSIYLIDEKTPPYGVKNYDSSYYLEKTIYSKANFFFFPPKIIEDMRKVLSENNKLMQKLKKREEKYFILTGGGKVNAEILSDLYNKGIAIYEGYGLSENASVTSLNSKKNAFHKIGSVGKALENNFVKLINDEIYLKSNSLYIGHLEKNKYIERKDDYHATGDIGEIDKDLFIHIKGRKKSVIILSSSRNICPEHIESIYQTNSQIESIVVIGDGSAYLTGIVLCSCQFNDEIFKKENILIEKKVPDFAIIKKFILIKNKNQFRKKFFTVTNRPRRALIQKEVSNLKNEY